MQQLRVAIGGIAHESNGFLEPTRLDDFSVQEGDAIVAANRGTRTYLGGMIAGGEGVGATIAPTYAAAATPSGTIAQQAWEAMVDGLVTSIRKAVPLDAVCLALHGAGSAEGCDDIETDILRRVREAVGEQVPIAVTLDLHANLRAEMLLPNTMLFGVHHYPHVDAYDRGVEAMEALARRLRGDIAPVQVLERIPLLIGGNSTSDTEPVQSINARCWEWERRSGVLNVTFFHGFVHTDLPVMGATVVAMTDGNEELARAAARDVAQYVWTHRSGFKVSLLDVDGAIREVERVLATRGGPVVVNEPSDNPGGGAPGDGTHLIRAFLAAPPHRVAFAWIYDPEVVRQAAPQVGQWIHVRLGGKSNPLHGTPIEARAYVKCLSDGRFVHTTPMKEGWRADLGPCARLQIGRVDVIVTSVREQVFDAEIFHLHGIDPSAYDVVAVKSSHHFRAGFKDLATQIITADTPGVTTRDLRALLYQRLNRPVAPLDANATYPSSQLGT